MLKKLVVGCSLLLGAGVAQAETFDLNISDEAVRAAISGPLSVGNVGGARYDFGYLYSDKRDARLNAGHVGLLVSGDAGARNANVHVGIGLRGVGIDLRAGSGGAVAVGGEFDLRLPDFNRVGLVGYGYIAPSVLAFSDIDGYSDVALTIDYEVIRNASLYAGFRHVRVKVHGAGGSSTADNSPIIGLRLRF